MAAQDNIKLAVMANDITYIKQQLDQIDGKVSNHYVTKDEFALHRDRLSLLQNIVFGLVGLILIAVIGAIMAELLG